MIAKFAEKLNVLKNCLQIVNLDATSFPINNKEGLGSVFLDTQPFPCLDSF